MNKAIKEQLQALARAQYGTITPLKRAYTTERIECDNVLIYGYYLFWFNTPDNSTHIVKIKIENP